MGKGKKGKMLFGALGFFLGAGGWGQAFFGASNSVVGGLYGASLAGTLWSSVNKPKQDYGNEGVQRFDKVMNTMSSTVTIPVIYGERKWGGNQTYHKANPELNMLRKHVVLCEGGIQGIKNVSANDLIIPTGNQIEGTVFLIQNVKHGDAKITVWKTDQPTGNDKCMRLSAGGKVVDIILAHYGDAERNDMFQYNCDIASLVSYINKLGNGWQAYPYSTTKKSPEDIYDIPEQGCYNTQVPARVDSVRGNTKYIFHDCEAPDTFAETGGYKNCAWLDMDLAVSDELNGNPNITAIIQGKKVLDLRTNGIIYSTNPVMCLLDFLMSERYGLGFPRELIDSDSFKLSADWCDQIIEFKNADGSIEKRKRYELNMIIDNRKSAIDWIGEILSNFCGYIVINKGVLALRIERATSIIYHFDENIIVGEIAITQDSLKETPNKYEVSFTDPLNNWNTAKCVVEDTAAQKDHKIITKSVELSGVTSQNQALRLARFYRDMNTVCNTTISFSAAMQAMHLECGDVISVSWYEVFDKAPWRIIEISEGNDGKFKIKARQYNASIYNDSLGASIQWYDYTTMPNGLASVQDVSQLEAVEYNEDDGTSSILVTFTCPDTFFRYAEVYMKTDNPHSNTISDSVSQMDGNIKSVNNAQWTFLENAKESSLLKNATKGMIYTFKLVSTNRYGVRGSFSDAPICSITAAGFSLTPQTPTGFIVSITNKIIATWNMVRNATEYEIWVGNAKIISSQSKTADLTGLLTERTGILRLYAVNENGRSLPVSVSYNKPAPPMPISFEAHESIQAIIINTEDLPMYSLGINIHLNEKVIFSAANYYTASFLAGIYDVRVAFVDVFGEGVLSKNIHIQIKPTIVPALIAAESLSLEKMDGVIKGALEKAQKSASAISVQQTKDSLTTIVRELGKSADKCCYTAIAQTNNAIQLRAEKDKLISSINLCPEAITINGKYIHVTGDTVFDKNVIVGNMLSANCITADKIDATVFNLVDHNISAGGVCLDSTGMKVVEDSGAYTKFDNKGITWYSPEGVTSGAIHRTVSGVVPAGKYVRLNWTKTPLIMMSLHDISMTAEPSLLRCYPSQISKEGFRVNLMASRNDGIYGYFATTAGTLYSDGKELDAYSSVSPANTTRTSLSISINATAGNRPGYEQTLSANLELYRSFNSGEWVKIDSITIGMHGIFSIPNDFIGKGTYQYKIHVSGGHLQGIYGGYTQINADFSKSSHVSSDNDFIETPVNGNVSFIALETDENTSYTIED